MKYFIDTEFLEGTQEPKWLILKGRLGNFIVGKPKPTIDLISIGIVANDGREYYAISKDFNLKEAWNRFDLKYNKGMGDANNSPPTKVYWIRDNILKLIWRELFFLADECSGLSNKQTEAYYQEVNSGDYDHYFTLKSLRGLIFHYGKTNKQIAEEVKNFTRKVKSENDILVQDTPEFYAYYADYDWVVFCWIFGKMIDLPKGFPMYCRDLKQMIDELYYKVGTQSIPFKKWIELIKCHSNYPKQETEHNALADARWNKKLYEFLKTI